MQLFAVAVVSGEDRLDIVGERSASAGRAELAAGE